MTYARNVTDDLVTTNRACGLVRVRCARLYCRIQFQICRYLGVGFVHLRRVNCALFRTPRMKCINSFKGSASISLSNGLIMIVRWRSLQLGECSFSQAQKNRCPAPPHPHPTRRRHPPLLRPNAPYTFFFLQFVHPTVAAADISGYIRIAMCELTCNCTLV